jgi:hypothetical protein
MKGLSKTDEKPLCGQLGYRRVRKGLAWNYCWRLICVLSR